MSREIKNHCQRQTCKSPISYQHPRVTPSWEGSSISRRAITSLLTDLFFQEIPSSNLQGQNFQTYFIQCRFLRKKEFKLVQFQPLLPNICSTWPRMKPPSPPARGQQQYKVIYNSISSFFPQNIKTKQKRIIKNIKRIKQSQIVEECKIFSIC